MAMVATAPEQQGPAEGGDSAEEADRTLIRAVANGDRTAFETIYQAHQRRLFRIAYGVLLDADDAREAVQEAFIRLYEVAETWEPKELVGAGARAGAGAGVGGSGSAASPIGAWLHRVVLNHCLDLRRRIARRAAAFFSARPLATAAPPPTPEMTMAFGEAIVVVEKSLRAMPIKQRAVACMFLESDLRPTELAPLVGLSPNAARVTLHRALTRLRDDLATAGIDATVHDPDLSTWMMPAGIAGEDGLNQNNTTKPTTKRGERDHAEPS